MAFAGINVSFLVLQLLVMWLLIKVSIEIDVHHANGGQEKNYEKYKSEGLRFQISFVQC